MSVDRRRANSDWPIVKDDGRCFDMAVYGSMQLAVLMDLRDELQRLNALLACPNFTGIPATLRSIRRKLPTPKAERR